MIHTLEAGAERHHEDRRGRGIELYPASQGLRRQSVKFRKAAKLTHAR